MKQSFRLSVHPSVKEKGLLNGYDDDDDVQLLTLYLSISQELNMTKLLLMLKRAQSIRLIYMYVTIEQKALLV